MASIKSFLSSFVFALLVVIFATSSAGVAGDDLPAEDPQARAMFERFASMYADLERYHERAVTKTEIESDFEALKRFEMQKMDAWEYEFQTPNLLHLRTYGQELVSDGDRIIAPNQTMGFFVEGKADGRRGMLTALETLSGEQPVVPPTLIWLFATGRDDVARYFEPCAFTGTGAEKLEGVACIWIDATWHQKAGFGMSGMPVDGRLWFAAESGRLRRIEVDITEAMNESVNQSMKSLASEEFNFFPEMPIRKTGRLIEKARSITDIIESDIPDRISASLFVVDDVEGLEQARTLTIAYEKAMERMTSRVMPGESLAKDMVGDPALGFGWVDHTGDRSNLAEQSDSIVVLLVLVNNREPMVDVLKEFDAFASAFDGLPVVSIAKLRLNNLADHDAINDFMSRDNFTVRIIEENGNARGGMLNRVRRDSVVLVDQIGVVQAVYELIPNAEFPHRQLINDVGRLLDGDLVYDEIAVNDRRERDRAVMAERERIAPLLRVTEDRSERITMERVGRSWGYVMITEDINSDGVVDVLMNPGMGRLLLYDGRSGGQSTIVLEDVDEMENLGEIVLVRSRAGLGLMITSSITDPLGKSTSTLGVFEIDGRKRWRWTLTREAEGFYMGENSATVGDLNGNGYDEIAVLMPSENNEANTFYSERLLVIFDADGDVIASKDLGDQISVIKYIGSDRPGERGWLLSTGAKGTHRIDLDI